jgi:dihydropteroate synthase-like protein
MTEHIHFITGRLAQHALRALLAPLAREVGFTYHVEVLPITVAALMTPAWIAQRMQPVEGATRLLIPGYCTGALKPLEEAAGIPVQRGPRDLGVLHRFFHAPAPPTDYGDYSIEIIAEINHCPRRPLQEIRFVADELARDGADIIDLGCEPGSTWQGVEDAVKALVEDGHRVSIDSFDRREVERAVQAGAELVLSVNRGNREMAADWGVEVVAIPDMASALSEAATGDGEIGADCILRDLDATIEHLTRANVRFRIDPILEPIGFGFAASLGRYLTVRKHYPEAPMLMGIGNLTELTDVDSAGVNALLIGFCQEQNIGSLLTTQVIGWARSSCRECDLARRLMYHAVRNQVVPKHLEPDLVMLRDTEIIEASLETLEELSMAIRDTSYRIYASGGQIHLVGRQLHLRHTDPMVLMEELERRLAEQGRSNTLSPDHAFYLGYEMSKAATALTLGKSYQQDEPLNWGMLTRQEVRHRLTSGRQGPKA